jgi:hypothetical protein
LALQQRLKKKVLILFGCLKGSSGLRSRKPHVLLTYPVSLENSGTSSKAAQRFPMTGMIDEIGMDIKRIKEIGISHIVFGYDLSPIGRNIDRMISTTKQLSKFAK